MLWLPAKRRRRAQGEGRYGMYSAAMLIYWLAGHVTREQICFEQPACTGGIILLSRARNLLRPEELSIGRPEDIVRLITCRAVPERCIVLCAGDSPELQKAALPEKINLIVTDLELVELYNLTQYHVHRFFQWEQDMRARLYQNAGLEPLIREAGNCLEHAAVVLFNAGYKVLAAHYSAEAASSVLEEAENNGYLSFETVQRLLEREKRGGEHRRDEEDLLTGPSENRGLLLPIEYHGSLVGRLFVLFRGEQAVRAYRDIAELVRSYASEYLLSSRSVDYSANTQLGSLLADLIDCRLTDPGELEDRLKQTRLVYGKYYYVVLFMFPNAEKDASGRRIPWNYVISQLEQVFPAGNLTMYHGKILMLLRRTASNKQVTYDEKQLQYILEYYDGFMAIGNYSKFLTSLPSLYNQVCTTVEYGRAMNTNPSQRVFRYEDYSVYNTIELCAKAARNVYGGSNLIYLCSPTLISLLRYDRKTDGNLCQVLHTYLINDRNATVAAKKLYIHRNTMLYKIHRIEEIIGQDLENPMLRERLLFSYHVIEYMERIQHENILVLKPNLQESAGERKNGKG